LQRNLNVQGIERRRRVDKEYRFLDTSSFPRLGKKRGFIRFGKPVLTKV